MFSQIWENFDQYFLKYFFSSILFLLYLWNSNDFSVRSFVIISYVPDTLFFFFFLRLCSFVSVCFLSFVQIRKILLYCLQVHWFFPLSPSILLGAYPLSFLFQSFCFLVLKFIFGSSYNFSFFVETFCFLICFKYVYNFPLKISYNSCFKSL